MAGVHAGRTPPTRDSIDKLSMFYVRNNNGDPVPLDSVINVTHGWAPEFLIRQNMFNSSQLNITPAEGYSSGQVMNALEEVFAQTMPAAWLRLFRHELSKNAAARHHHRHDFRGLRHIRFPDPGLPV